MIQTISPEYFPFDVDPKNVNPDTLPIFDGTNAYNEYAKVSFGDVDYKFWHFLDMDIVTSDVENPGIGI